MFANKSLDFCPVVPAGCYTLLTWRDQLSQKVSGSVSTSHDHEIQIDATSVGHFVSGLVAATGSDVVLQLLTSVPSTWLSEINCCRPL